MKKEYLEELIYFEPEDVKVLVGKIKSELIETRSLGKKKTLIEVEDLLNLLEICDTYSKTSFAQTMEAINIYTKAMK